MYMQLKTWHNPHFKVSLVKYNMNKLYALYQMIELYSFYLKKSRADITILESYIQQEKFNKSLHIKFRYRKPATALLPLIESLKEKHSAISEL